ncbi:hypothetical protein GCM10027404_10660 [Arthrobacter tumbae]
MVTEQAGSQAQQPWAFALEGNDRFRLRHPGLAAVCSMVRLEERPQGREDRFADACHDVAAFPFLE